MISKKDYKLFLSLILWTLIPSIYLLIRMHIVSINNVNINILGQMEWFDLIDETIVTILTVPLYHLLKTPNISNKKNGQAFIISFGIYTVFTIIIALKCGSITKFMNAEYATTYLILQAIAMLIAFISTFMILLLTLNNDHKTVYILTIVKLILLTVSDMIFIPKFADTGAAYSEIAVNTITAIIATILVFRQNYIKFGKWEKPWLSEWTKIGSWAGVQIIFANVIYGLVVVRMINAVSESGNYWIANNFIWGWLLVPVTCLTEIIKKNKLASLNFKNTWRYCIGIALIWLITIPGWRWFLTNAMSVDATMILNIIYPVMPFYIAYLISQMIEAWFISHGKTIYNGITSIIVNIVYYGVAYILFQKNIFTIGIPFIIGLFGWGMVFGCILDIIFYAHEKHKKGEFS